MRIRSNTEMARRLAKHYPKIVRRLHEDEDGATAVEFAMVAFPFFLLIFAIIETSLFFFAGQYLETAVDDTTRLFRTGQLDASTTNSEFRDAFCDRIVAMFECDNIYTNVEVATEFGDLPAQPPLPNFSAKNASAASGFPAAGQLGPLVVMRITASYQWPVFTNECLPSSPGSLFRNRSMYCFADRRAGSSSIPLER